MTTKSDTARKTGVVHFTIGEDMGIRLMEIAQEHLVIDNNPVKAVTVITDSLIGCPVDYALKILKGDIVLLVDVESQTIIPVERIPEIHDRIFPKIDVVDFMRKKELQIEKHRMNLVSGWKMLENQILRNKNTFWAGFDYKDIFSFIAGNNEVILDTLRDIEELNHIESLIVVSKQFIEHTMKIQSTIEWMSKTWNEFETISGHVRNNPWVDYVEIKQNISSCLTDVMEVMESVLNLDFQFTPVEDNVQKYLNSLKEIDVVMSEGIKPVDIMDNYSAGWLSPEGEFYGLNGEIANMLHNQIANSLQEIGIIPEYESDEYKKYDIKINPDAWLEQHGWVKIHGNNINYGGCLNSQIGKTNVQMTEKQAKIIAEYITECHAGIMRLGWKMQRATSTMFLMAFRDIIAMNKKYFEF
jgi:hypothetical protein